MYDYMYQYKCDLERIYHNCRKDDPQTYLYQCTVALYDKLLVNYKEWVILKDYINNYIDNTLTNGRRK